MSKKIFVGNLSFQTTESDITNAFAQYGDVESVSVITDRDSGRSKGFGFVLMDDGGAEWKNCSAPQVRQTRVTTSGVSFRWAIGYSH